MTGRSAPRHRTTERYRAAQGKNDYTNLPHDLAARPAGKFQFICLLRKADMHNIFYIIQCPRDQLQAVLHEWRKNMHET